jgi:hypothetical protein
MMFVIAATFASIAVSANETADMQRFHLVGSGSLTLDQPVQKSGNFQIKADLTPSDFAGPPSSSGQKSGRYALSATLATSSLICYSDTIFRDSFDGTDP